ncbi:MAG: Indolepyruvate ferredoxin oxidoreductase [Parcubacteria group bacterium GW2011_GWA2_47_9]|uniref:Pyruvate/ketoisovalerate oxidoreductase catalytic domain-containing protein n=1 Tax=Candidatus Wildermuthbacteria bacterium RIFCSPHIGHO2_02_FULL_47_17 TaxID=1802452 RepID=A0A1G2R207_9BACT|nr:MAG: Indolepyruvate ferredoxin oxidoreductase [Parcubacteria group bacterium GW2011_GWA2_47_9]OHA66886.1 MAG: hypothetical protein A3D59_04600 [Candidatus Wildermuthbacteria bacterium RIFCSPHIGHO2_02_FULL_47_17]
MKKDFDNFNILISGVGGQGLITLIRIIGESALAEGYDVKTSELHGLSQRGGSVEVHLIFGKKINSPLILPGTADLILALESQEALAAANFAHKNSIFLINKYQTPTFTDSITNNEIEGNLKKFFPNIFLVPANEICQQELGTGVASGVYLLGLASFRGWIPLRSAVFLSAMKRIVPEKYLDLNLKAFNLPRKNHENYTPKR